MPLPAGQWPTFGGNPQRDGWARDETMLTRDNVKSMKLMWKVHVNSQLREMNSLTAPVVSENVLTAQGHKDIVVVAGAIDTLDAIDIDTGKVLWHKQFTAEGKPKQQPRWLCPNSLNATPAIQSGGISPRDRSVLAIASDGKLHSLNIVNGEDRMAPVAFRSGILQKLESQSGQQRPVYRYLARLQRLEIGRLCDGHERSQSCGYVFSVRYRGRWNLGTRAALSPAPTEPSMPRPATALSTLRRANMEMPSLPSLPKT